MYSQQPYRCRFDWGHAGTRKAAERGDIVVVVDTLRFSTTVATALHHGGIIYPCSRDDDPKAFAQRVGAEVAQYLLEDVPTKDRFSLSPHTYFNMKAGTRVVLTSPNGATCSRYARQVPYLFVGALVNAESVAQTVSSLLDKENLCVTIIACGERWRPATEDGELRVAIEDYLGAGAILSYLPHEKSPEARVCEGAFIQVRNDLEPLLWESGSGRELREKGFGEDVRLPPVSTYIMWCRSCVESTWKPCSNSIFPTKKGIDG